MKLPIKIMRFVDDLFPVETPEIHHPGQLKQRAILLAEKIYGEVKDDDTGKIEIVRPNETSLAIIRLFLEKLETLTADERKEILAVIRYLNNPMLISNSPTLDSHKTP